MGQFFDTVCCIDETKLNSYVSDEEEEYKEFQKIKYIIIIILIKIKKIIQFK